MKHTRSSERATANRRSKLNSRPAGPPPIHHPYDTLFDDYCFKLESGTGVRMIRRRPRSPPNIDRYQSNYARDYAQPPPRYGHRGRSSPQRVSFLNK